MKLINTIDRELWQVNITINMLVEYDRYRKVLEMKDWLTNAKMHWYEYFGVEFFSNTAILTWVFLDRDDAMLFELTWG